LETHKEASILIASINIASSDVKKIDKFVQYSFSSLDQTIVEPLSHKIYPLSIKQNYYPEIWKAYDSSKLFDNKEVASWSKVHAINKIKKNQEQKDNKKLYYLKKHYLDQDILDNNMPSIGSTILKRGSARRFSDVSIPLNILSTILLNSSDSGGNIPMDYKPDNSTLIEYYVLVNSVEGLESGAYYLDKDIKCLEFLRERPTKDFSGHLCLDQSLFENASVIIFLMADLNFVLRSLGNRGYRAAQLESGIIAGKIYLLSYACGIGASGSTFYDDEVNAFFCPSNKQMATMIAVGVGVPSYKSKPGTILPVRLSREQMIGKNSSIF
jgi:SagB-type dehydrogenase family enzyme